MAIHPNYAHHQKRWVQILNPAGGPGRTSAKRALRFVTQGRARYVSDGCIEMIEGDYRHLSAGRTEPAPRPHSPTPLKATYEYDGPVNLRTFARYPDTLAFVF